MFMQPLPSSATLPESFVPVGDLPDWTQTMRRATHAHHTGQLVVALAHYQSALAMARSLLASSHDGESEGESTVSDTQADARLSALVSSHRCLADLQSDQGCPELAAGTLAQVHTVLLGLLRQYPQAHAWHRAAVWHCRDTHAALLAHWAEYGAHPDIDRAMRAGCLPWGLVSAGTSRH